MSWLVRVLPRGEKDIEEEAIWHEKKQAGLGHAFVDEVSRSLRILGEDAHRHTLYYQKYHRILLRRFPYKIFYRFQEGEVVVFRVLHAKREHRYRLPSKP